jgi:uncharacterized repeat protein (TIGR03803 family)
VPFCPDSNGSLQGGPVGGWQKRADWAGHTFGRGHWISDHVGRRERSGSGTVLHAFNGADGIRPDAGAILDVSGNVYRTTSGGGGSRCDCGTVFKLSLGTNGKWTRTVLHRFNGKDGANPFAGEISDAAGNLYPTTWLGGNSQNPCYSNCGVVFKLSPGANGAWTETVLHEFNGKDGAELYAGLIFDGAGNLYGATSVGGASSCCGFGTVFKLSPGSEWQVDGDGAA